MTLPRPQSTARRRLLPLLALLLAFALAPSQAQEPITERQKERLVEAVGKRLDRSAFALGTDFGRWDQIVEDHRDALDAAETKQAFAEALDTALDDFDLSHLGILSPSGARLQRRGQRTGIGITVHPRDDGSAFVSYVLQGSPADACGLRKGDVLLRIDGAPIFELDQLAGELGQKRRLDWRRGTQRLSCEFEYAPFFLSERSSMRWINDQVALIKIQSFQYRFYNAARINRFFREARRADGIIIDLRNNRGGLSFWSRHLASKIAKPRETFALVANRRHAKRVPPGSLTARTLAENARQVHPLPFSKPYRGAVVVLVDSLSASAADIVPAFVQESGRGLVIGQRTSGALQLARSFRLPFRFRLYLPTAELLTPGGARLEKNGVIPDIELSLEETANDAVLIPIALEALAAQSDSFSPSE